MIIFIMNMVAVSMVMMAAVCLIILRERTDTQMLMAAVCLEALVALGSLMWIAPDQLDAHFLTIRMLGRFLEGGIMWAVIINEVRSMRKTALSPTIAEVVTKEIDDLKKEIYDLKDARDQLAKEDDPNAPTH